MSQKYLKAVNDFIKPYLDKEGYVFLSSEFVKEDGNHYLRVYIDIGDELREKRKMSDGETQTGAELEEGFTEPGVDINDCVKVSRYLSKWLDKEDFITEAYTLEVCSRGFLNKQEDNIEGEEI